MYCYISQNVFLSILLRQCTQLFNEVLWVEQRHACFYNITEGFLFYLSITFLENLFIFSEVVCILSTLCREKITENKQVHINEPWKANTTASVIS